MQFKIHQDRLVRLQTSQNRDLKKGIILDRNERADSYKSSDFKKALNSFSINSFNATPDISQLYKEIAKLHKVNRNNIYIKRSYIIRPYNSFMIIILLNCCRDKSRNTNTITTHI